MARFSFSPFVFSIVLHAGAAALFFALARNAPFSLPQTSSGPIEVSLIEPVAPQKIIENKTRALPSPQRDESAPGATFTPQSSRHGQRLYLQRQPSLHKNINVRSFRASSVRRESLRTFNAPQPARVVSALPAVARPNKAAKTSSPNPSVAPAESRPKVSSASPLPRGVSSPAQSSAPQTSRDAAFDQPLNNDSASPHRSVSPRGGFGNWQPRGLPAGRGAGDAGGGSSVGGLSGGGSGTRVGGGSNFGDGKSGNGRENSGGENAGGNSRNENYSGDENNKANRGDDASTRIGKPAGTRRSDDSKPQKARHDSGKSTGGRGRGRGSRVEIDRAEMDEDVARRVRRPAKIKARIKAKGEVEFSLEESSGDRDFDQKSLDIVRKGRYKPKTNDRGEAEETERIIKVRPPDD